MGGCQYFCGCLAAHRELQWSLALGCMPMQVATEHRCACDAFGPPQTDLLEECTFWRENSGPLGRHAPSGQGNTSSV